MPIELRHLRYVIAAAEQRSFRRAAQALGVRESAVSRRIRELEEDLGSSLFIRQPSGVVLTYAGKRFVRQARRVLAQVEDVAKDVGAIGRGENGVVRIGLFSSLASGFLAELVQAYNANHAGVRLDFVEGGPEGHVSAIRQHRLDIAFLIGAPAADGVDIAHLWNERVYVAMQETDTSANQDEVEWEDLRDRHFVVSEAAPGPEIRDYLVKHFAELGRRPSIQLQAVYRDNLMQLVASGQGLTLTTEATIATPFPGIAYRPLAGAILPFCAIWSPRNDNPAFRRLLSLAKSLSSGARPA